MQKSSPNMNSLANTLKKGLAPPPTPLVLDFGEIGGDYSLTTNTWPKPIPVTDYVVSRHLTHKEPLTETYEETCSIPHTHDVRVPDKMKALKPGDRVLVGWVQNDAVVMLVIVPATEVM